MINPKLGTQYLLFPNVMSSADDFLLLLPLPVQVLLPSPQTLNLLHVEFYFSKGKASVYPVAMRQDAESDKLGIL